MQNLIKLTTVFVLICLSINISFADQSKNNFPSNGSIDVSTNEMIVTFENLSPKRISELNERLINLPGITHMGSCPELRAYFLIYDSEKYASLEEAFDAVIISTKEFQPLLKIGSSINDVKSACELK